MTSSKLTFHNHLFSFDAGSLALHKNLMTCVIIGNQQPVTVSNDQENIEAEIVCIKPGVTHCVTVKRGGAEIMYLDGVCLDQNRPAFESLDLTWRALPFVFESRNREALTGFRELLHKGPMPPDQSIMQIVSRLYRDPLSRLSQLDLAHALDLERTQALRHFKATTGQTFRKFKIWAGIVAATHHALNGAQIGHAGVEAGFSDAAHLARTASTVFGTTPTNGLSGLKRLQTLAGED